MTTPTPDGLIVVAKADCPTCRLIEPLLAKLADTGPLRVYVQDTSQYAESLPGTVYDQTLEHSWRLETEFVPTLIRIEQGQEVARTYGWDKAEWRTISGLDELGEDLPAMRPGCGSKTLEPGIAERLELAFGRVQLKSREIDVSAEEDTIEACYARGWSDGLPVVPPTPVRVLRMLKGTQRDPQEIVGIMPPDLVPCTVEKIAINAVMAGCKPEYMPVLLAALEAALDDDFGLHGLICTTMFGSPMIMVNGPIAKAIGMNSGNNALGQGNRANATIGRALQLIIRNVGGGRPGEIDRATLGNPGKYTFCFAEAEDSDWLPLAQQRGIPAGRSAVTVFPGEGVQGIIDQKSRDPESLARSMAESLRAVDNVKLAMAGDAVLVVAPDHARIFIEAGWSKQRLRERLEELLLAPGERLVAGAGGIAEGIPEKFKDKQVPKFRPGGLLIVRAGGTAGLFSAIIAGWAASGPVGSSPVTREVNL
ncbi:thioredoxin family protein [Pseudohongiella spirulinae]|uniref:Thiol-disulfide oxidoreductase n=1 Tax=Pseudohongiella spirulinae TaxID=1249552 RepID=A0A0S2KCC3_9GAMM|nr:thioredoxin family protein [Pseudohongiella spirulinae]ALO45948.1 thiol-disulfide oxidoreductase [Pseudohongiella spirulinae]